MSMSQSIQRRLEALEGGSETRVEFIVVDRRGPEREVYRADVMGLEFSREADETEPAFLERVRTYVCDGRLPGRRVATVVFERGDLDG